MLAHLGQPEARRGPGQRGLGGAGGGRAVVDGGVGQGAARRPPGSRGHALRGRTSSAYRPAPKVEIYDTTLRDGSQQVGLDLTVTDKLRVAHGAGRPRRGRDRGRLAGLQPQGRRVLRAGQVAGAQERPAGRVRRDPAAAARRWTTTPTWPRCWRRRRRSSPWSASRGRCTWTRRCGPPARRTWPWCASPCAFIAAAGRRVVFDAEHFFDGYLADRGYALAVLAAAVEGGADTLALCDTNGGTLPDDVAAIVRGRRRLARDSAAAGRAPVRIGVHFHNDASCAVANSVVAVAAGGLHVQGAANGYGERCGNADLFSVIASLELKRGHELLPAGPPERAGLDGADHRRRGQPAVRRAPALRRAVRVRDQGRAARLGHRAAARRLLPHRARPPSATSPGPGQRAGRAQQRAGQGGRAGPGPEHRPGPGRPGAGPGQGGRAPRLRVRGGGRLVRAAGPAQRRDPGRPGSSWRATGWSSSAAPRRTAARPSSGCSSAPTGWWPSARASARCTRSTRRCAAAWSASTRPWSDIRAGRLQGAHPGRPGRHPRRHPGHGHLGRRRRRVDDGRGVRGHRHRVVGGAGRRRGLRPAPRGRRGPAIARRPALGGMSRRFTGQARACRGRDPAR